ncbi:MAG: hypothetical protein A2847_00170 [Candidatus Sungbacteria bacterium RIFCSPHIGHO2_01_FULL_50_25]|uniref:Queuine tRNA-ribosyltransferase n=1 Tax=Candidatus Sungbacteria bacterium RIFCSPHIGHO2_01_FULL_50_25 TaxID=1802265 RepID=A0A1G2KD06_9BACT|nr:MAG: hypothetical protein A2847_00170 [Candidatus Sungbacteria bacterium RIFCSPHIGHO2_01_FULL_50_25]
MIRFTILKESARSRARAGILETPHGIVETPALVPVATQGAIKALTIDRVYDAKTEILIANTYHLHLRPGEKTIGKAGGLHHFMNWQKPLMTDSGGFQVFSLGFGEDHGVGKVLAKKRKKIISTGDQPKKLTITEDGVAFRSSLDGREVFLGPKESIDIQESLGADIMFSFDECTSPLADRAYVKKSLERTHRWIKASLRARRSRAALYGIVQGSHFKDLRQKSAAFANSLDFDGFGIGGDLGTGKDVTKSILSWTVPILDKRKPRHLLGIGKLDDLALIIKGGADTFDCIVPTRYARHGIAFTSKGKLNMAQRKFLSDTAPLDPKCRCTVCATHKRNYISHLYRAGEISALSLLTFHNLFYYHTVIESIRQKIKNGKL